MNTTQTNETERYFIHPKAYWRVIIFIEKFCVHVKGEKAKQKIILPTWFKWQIRTVYGRYDRNTHRRAIREAYLEVPKKAGKSLYISALSNYHMIADGYYNEGGQFIQEESPEVICAASTKDQAKIIFESSQWMVKYSEYLSSKLRCMQWTTTEKNGPGFFKVLSSDAGGSEGINTSANLIDEIHAHCDGGALYKALKGAGAARSQPLTWIITTAGVYDQTSIYWNRREYAMKVINDWKFDPHYHACIYTAGQDKEEEYYLSEEAIKIANPNYPQTPTREYLESRAREAKNDPAMMNAYLQYHLNVVVMSHSEWIPRKYVVACNLSDEKIKKGESIWIGFDIGDTDDLTCLFALADAGRKDFEIEEEGKKVTKNLPTFNMMLRCFCPADKLDAAKNNTQHITYMKWAKAGLIDIAGNNTINVEYIESIIDQWNLEYQIRGMSFDRFGASELGVRLDRKYSNRGKDFVKVLNMNAMSVSPPMKTLGSFIKIGQINTYGNPVFEWMMANVMVKVDPNQNIFPNKKEAKGKIDGVVAGIMATDAWMHDRFRDRPITSFKAKII